MLPEISLIFAFAIKENATGVARRLWYSAAFVVITAAVAMNLAGCANSALATARQNIAAHNYAAAHQQALAALENPQKLSTAERREAEDDLCEAEFSIGAPRYSLSQQRRRCEQAVREPGSRSGSTLRRIDVKLLAVRSQQVDDALAQGDLASALRAAEDYSSIEGADPHQLGRWRRQIWRMLDQRDAEAMAGHHRQERRAIARLGHDFRGIRTMNRKRFERWVRDQMALGGPSMVSSVNVRRGVAEIAVEREMLPALSLNLAGLVKVNDALSARCRCAGKTRVVLPQTGFPIYAATLNPALLRSQVLILPQPQL